MLQRASSIKSPRISPRARVIVSRRTAIVIWCIALCASIQAQAGSPVPDKAGAFVAYCANHLADCKDKIVQTDLLTLAAKLSANNAAQFCAIPKGIDIDNATKEILAWMGQHKNVHAMKTEDGIHAAVKDLWHCQLQIGDGSEPGGPPAKTGAFVGYCPTHYGKCANEIFEVSLGVILDDPPKHCSPPENVEAKELAVAVLGWLDRHKETYELKTEDGILAAIDHLWPCRLRHA